MPCSASISRIGQARASLGAWRRGCPSASDRRLRLPRLPPRETARAAASRRAARPCPRCRRWSLDEPGRRRSGRPLVDGSSHCRWHDLVRRTARGAPPSKKPDHQDAAGCRLPRGSWPGRVPQPSAVREVDQRVPAPARPASEAAPRRWRGGRPPSPTVELRLGVWVRRAWSTNSATGSRPVTSHTQTDSRKPVR